MHRICLLFGLLCLMASVATAQTKISGTEECAKPESLQTLPVGDRADHTIGIAQLKCTWTKPMEIEGVPAKESIIADSSDTIGNVSRYGGYEIGIMASGDKYYVRYRGAKDLKDGLLQSDSGTWSFFGGTGKQKGMKGKGTHKCKAAGEGFSCEIEGEYELPKAAATR
jgi:hypothetical protein